MSSDSPPAGLSVTPTKEGSSRLELLRAKVQNSREKVADQKRRISHSSFDGNASSSSVQSAETKPLHIQHKQEWSLPGDNRYARWNLLFGVALSPGFVGPECD